ncbi:MAG TPA: TraR/DksA family transcriptional regulator [Chloroflexota bacterium]|nr:TraR/DksA family transcriptional regulator [Chloroflexota bacterium]
MPKRKRKAEDPLARRAEAVARLRDFVDNTTFAGDQREAADELSMVDQHIADVADITVQREVDYTIKGIVEEEAERVQEAIQRRAQGLYGICEDCDQPISRARLKARPQATLCINCQRKREGWGGRN